MKGAIFTAVHERGRRNTIIESARDNAVDTLHRALAFGGDVNARTRQGDTIHGQQQLQATALIVAARRNHLPIVQTLLDHGADIHAENRAGDTLHTVAARNGHYDAAKILIFHDTDPFIRNRLHMIRTWL